MLTSPLTWLVAAVLLFWAIGAYNRLVRLRAEAKAAFEQHERQLQQEIHLAGRLQHADASGLQDSEAASWTALHGAAAQLSATLTLARHAPLDADRIDALRAAEGVLAMAWERVERLDAHALAGPHLPEDLSAARAALATEARASGEAFNRSVARYNEAIAQFPASLLAWVFAFRPGRAL